MSRARTASVGRELQGILGKACQLLRMHAASNPGKLCTFPNVLAALQDFRCNCVKSSFAELARALVGLCPTISWQLARSLIQLVRVCSAALKPGPVSAICARVDILCTKHAVQISLCDLCVYTRALTRDKKHGSAWMGRRHPNPTSWFCRSSSIAKGMPSMWYAHLLLQGLVHDLWLRGHQGSR